MPERRASASTVCKHSLVVAGHQTSISLEAAFWSGLKNVAAHRGLSIAALVAEIDRVREASNLSSAIRVFVLEAAIANDLRSVPPERSAAPAGPASELRERRRA